MTRTLLAVIYCLFFTSTALHSQGALITTGAFADGNGGESEAAAALTSFNAWANLTLPAASSSQFTGDQDSDGLPDGLEYATRTDPAVSNVNPLGQAVPVTLSTNDPATQFSFRYRSNATDLRYIVQRSADPAALGGGWLEIYRFEPNTGRKFELPPASVTEDVANGIITLTDPTLGTQLFWRLVAEYVPSEAPLTSAGLVADWQAEITRLSVSPSADDEVAIGVIQTLLADQDGHDGDISSYSAKWLATIESYNPDGVSELEARLTAIIRQFLQEAHSIVHDGAPCPCGDFLSCHCGSNSPPADATCVQNGRWSNPATWGGTMPMVGSNVVIPAGRSVLLDVSPPPLGSVTVMGLLTVGRQATTLTARYIMVHMGGVFQAGTEASPFAHKLVITLTGTNVADVPGMGTRFLGAMHGGTISLIGQAPEKSWAMLNKTAIPGDTTILLDSYSGWSVGSEIIVTSTSTDYTQTEKRRIVGVAGGRLTLDAPLTYQHNGTVTKTQHGLTGAPTMIDTRAEVALLTRPIVVQGPEDSDATQFGAHGMIMGNDAIGKFQGVEFFRGGQSGILGRYPIHWHDVNNGGANSFIRKCSVHRSYNRAMTIHKTNFMTLTENVAYDIKGYGFFLEDGKEVRNVFTRNLAAMIQDGALDERDGVGTPYPSGFWISNPDNDFIDNAVAGAEGHGNGFWYDVKEHPRAGSISTDPNYFCELQPMGIFRGNRVHSIHNASDLGRGGWGVALEFDNGRTDNLVQDFTVFAVQGVGIYNPEIAKIGGSVTYERLRAVSDFVAFKGNFLLKDSLCVTPGYLAGQPPNRSVLTMGYDGTPQIQGTVFAGYGNSLSEPGHNPISIATWLDNCKPIDSYVTYGPALPQDRFCLLISDPNDAWGNGAPGVFVNQPYLTEATGNAKGVHPDDTETRWSPDPYGAIEIRHPTFEQVLVGEYPMIRSGASSIGVLSMRKIYRLTFVGVPDGRISEIFPQRESRNAGPNDAMRIVFKAPAGLTGLRFDFRRQELLPPLATLEEWLTAPGNNWYLDPSGDLYMSLKGGFPYGVSFYYDGAKP